MIKLVSDRNSSYTICISQGANIAERFAAQELSDIIYECTGARLPVSDEAASPAIFVGPCDKELREDELYRAVRGNDLVLSGGRPHGTLYSVYEFAREYLGCRWLAPDETIYPRCNDFSLPEFDDFTYIPPFEYRNSFSWSANNNPLWAVRNGMNGLSFAGVSNIEHLGGASPHCPASHSFYALVPPDEYFGTHPEYFSMIDGKRNPHSQLCLSNPDVLRICTEKLRKQLRVTKNAGVSFSQNDWLGACECPECAAIDKYCGAHSGSIITFCNKLAEALCDEFPDKLIQTYAYQYGQSAPKNLRVHKNVSVWLCSVEACYAHPHGTCSHVRRELLTPDGKIPDLAQDIADWGKICDNLFVWDYALNCRNHLLPHPNLRVINPNMRFYRDCHVRGIFEQQCYTTPHTEFQELRSYIAARSLYDPDSDPEILTEEFIRGYYGNTAEEISAYVRLLHDTCEKMGHHLYLSEMPDLPEGRDDAIRSSLTRSWYDKLVASGRPIPEHGLAKYLTPELLAEANALFDRAEAHADCEKILRRVRIARLPIRYTELSQIPYSAPGYADAVDEFIDRCEDAGITELKEGSPIERTREMLKKGVVFY